MKIEDVEGIGPGFAQKLTAAGVGTTDALLTQAGTSAGRDRLSEATGISEKQLLEWVNHADLMRISGVGSEYADLLEAAGVDSCAELARRVQLLEGGRKVRRVPARPNWIRQIPGEKTIAGWIEQAAGLDTVVSH